MAKRLSPIEFPAAKVVDAEEAAKNLPRRTSNYDAVIAVVAALKPGKSAVFPFPKEFNTNRAANGLTAAMQARGVKAPAGHGFYKQVDKDNALVVTVRERKVGPKAKAKKGK